MKKRFVERTWGVSQPCLSRGKFPHGDTGSVSSHCLSLVRGESGKKLGDNNVCVCDINIRVFREQRK
jgi:hypothetical protein